MYDFYKSACLFDLKQLFCISNDIDSYTVIKDLQDPSIDLFEEFQTYVSYLDALLNPFSITVI